MKKEKIACKELDYEADEKLQLARVNAVLTNGTVIKDRLYDLDFVKNTFYLV